MCEQHYVVADILRGAPSGSCQSASVLALSVFLMRSWRVGVVTSRTPPIISNEVLFVELAGHLHFDPPYFFVFFAARSRELKI